MGEQTPHEVHVEDVAAAILDRLGAIDTMKLQKLVYYCQAWHCAWRDEPMFPEAIEAWKEGPVARRLFAMHKGQYMVSCIRQGDASRLDISDEALVDFVCGRYGSLSGRDLSILTHEENPWRMTRDMAGVKDGDWSDYPISTELMRDYYRQDEEVAEQAWFWGPGWYAGEKEADADIEAGRTVSYDSADDFLASL